VKNRRKSAEEANIDDLRCYICSFLIVIERVLSTRNALGKRCNSRRGWQREVCRRPTRLRRRILRRCGDFKNFFSEKYTFL